MTATIQINERGSMTLPKKLRRRLGLEKGGVMMAETAEGGVLLRPAVAYPIEIYSDARIAEFDVAEAVLKRRLGPSQAKPELSGAGRSTRENCCGTS